jgi:hypothetical protein
MATVIRLVLSVRSVHTSAIVNVEPWSVTSRGPPVNAKIDDWNSRNADDGGPLNSSHRKSTRKGKKFAGQVMIARRMTKGRHCNVLGRQSTRDNNGGTF